MFEWLPLSDRKTMPTPRVVYLDLAWCGGYYAGRTTTHCLDDFGSWLDRKDGDIIVLSTHWGDPRPGVIAHEHRHLQQHYVKSLPQIGLCKGTNDDGTLGTWEREIRTFFRTQPWEMDALRYERRIAPDEVSESMVQAVQKQPNPPPTGKRPSPPPKPPGRGHV